MSITHIHSPVDTEYVPTDDPTSTLSQPTEVRRSTRSPTSVTRLGMVDPDCVPPEAYSARLEKSTTIPQVRARSEARAELRRAKKAETAALARLERAEERFKTADAAVQQLIQTALANHRAGRMTFAGKR